MSIYSMSDNTIVKALGARLQQRRLEVNITQKELAKRTMLSLNAIKAMEKGRGKIINLVSIMRELGELDTVDLLLPNAGPSPIQLHKMAGRQRQRARHPQNHSTNKGPQGDDKW